MSTETNRRTRTVAKASMDLRHGGEPSRPARKRRATKAERKLNAALEYEAMANMGLDDPCLYWGGVDNIGCK